MKKNVFLLLLYFTDSKYCFFKEGWRTKGRGQRPCVGTTSVQMYPWSVYIWYPVYPTLSVQGSVYFVFHIYMLFILCAYHGPRSQSIFNHTIITLPLIPHLAHFQIEYTTLSDHSIQHIVFNLSLSKLQTSSAQEGNLYTTNSKRLNWSNGTSQQQFILMKEHFTEAVLVNTNWLKAWSHFLAGLPTIGTNPRHEALRSNPHKVLPSEVHIFQRDLKRTARKLHRNNSSDVLREIFRQQRKLYKKKLWENKRSSADSFWVKLVHNARQRN